MVRIRTKTKAKKKTKARGKKPQVPFDIPTLSRWLALSPKEHLKELEATVTKASEATYEAQLKEPARLALRWAWDEQPEAFFPLVGAWAKGTNARLRGLAAGAAPMSHEGYREKSLKLLKKLSQDKDRRVRLEAIDQLAQEVNVHFDLIKKWAKTPDPEVKALVARHLQYADAEHLKKALPLLEELGCDGAPQVHWAVASTLYELYDRDQRPVLEAARKVAECEVEGARQAIAACFFEHIFADHFDQLLPTVRAWLRLGDANLRWTLCRSLRFLKVTARSLQLYRALYEDKDPEIRRRVAAQLVEAFDPRADHYRPVADMLRRAKEDAAKRVREVAEEGEERLGLEFDNLPVHGADLDLEDEGDDVELAGDDGGDDDDDF